ncbi:MAG TPA: arginine deiminase-related protein [Candidatus Saccharimonadales bacterium]
MSTQINTTVLMSGANFFGDSQAINPYMHKDAPIDVARAQAEHDSIQSALERAGISVVRVDPPADCQDGVYTANWALVRGSKAVMSRLPDARAGEEPYAEQILRGQGKTIYKLPETVHFSGQGDALPCGNYLFMGSGYRTDPAAHQFVADTLGYHVISLQTVPLRTWYGRAVINTDSGWPDSFFYDIDLALCVLTPHLIAWCPKAFTRASQAKIRAIKDIDKVEVSLREAKQAFACNLISTGETVVMSGKAPQLKAAIEAKGLRTVTPTITELVKGGGYIRCTTLTLE